MHKPIITRGMVLTAVELIRPSVEKILETRGMTWGPRWVEGKAVTPAGDLVSFRFGTESRAWNDKWGKIKHFDELAEKKLGVTLREKANTSVVVATRPWCLLPGEYLYAGGAYRDGIAVGISGAYGWVDEAIAEMVIAAIIMLARKETEARIKAKRMQIEL